jgi:uncharacterized membrane protein
MSERKIKKWVEAGLIDADAADRIRAWEDANSRPLGLWALIGLGGLAIGLGLVSVVAANWDDIRGTVRLALHFALMIGVGGWVWWQRRAEADQSRWFDDAALFIFGILGLTFFGHVGQVYQTSSPLWQAFLAWLLLFSPILLWQGRGWLVAAGWSAAVYFTASNYLSWLYEPNQKVDWAVLGTITSIPAMAMAVASALRSWVGNGDFWRRIEQIGLAVLVLGVSGSTVASAFGVRDGNNGEAMQVAVIQLLWLAIAAAIVRASRPNPSGRATAMILVIAGLVLMVTAILGTSTLLSAALFMSLWGAIAMGALSAGWRVVFQIAVAAVALRLIILSFEFADDLLGSGLGLIMAGVMTLGVAWIAVRISKRYAPVEGEPSA